MKILWGIRKGAEEWKEELLTEVEERIPAAKEWAQKNGFDRFRISEYTENEMPDFTGVLNK